MFYQKGVSLIELMVTIGIVAVLAAVAVPSLSGFVDSVRLASTTTLLLADLNRARSEAIKRNRRVLVCVSNAGGTDCATTTAWAAGWLVCTDADSNGACDDSTATDPNPLSARSAISGGMLISTSTAVASVRFNPDGSFTGNQPFTLRKGVGGTQKQINISGVGNISTQ
jgi:type IV fimbrial biogenesis protein FimT